MDQTVVPESAGPDGKGHVSIVLEDYQLSEHFTLGELAKTSHRKYMGTNREEAITNLDNLHKLCETVLEPVRTLMDVPVFITSGFRGPKLNKAIGGSKRSQHVHGEAADIEFLGAREGKPLRDAFNKIAFSSIPYSQIIYEFGQWIHIGMLDPERYPGKVGQKLVASRPKGKTIYTLITKPI